VQYLCCELADLQLGGRLPVLRVFDVSHTAWRLRVAAEVQADIDDAQQVSPGGRGVNLVCCCCFQAALCVGRG